MSEERWIREWRGVVYGKVDQEDDLPKDEWRRLRNAILLRDKNTCLRCDQKFKKPKLSVHHLVPRSEGGSYDHTNLVTLCHKCHDLVEICEFKTVADILGSAPLPVGTKVYDYEVVKNTPDPYNRPDWHRKVYGGER